MSAQTDATVERAVSLQAAGDLPGAAAVYRGMAGLGGRLRASAPDGAAVTGPDFLIIGAPRAGTGWLKRILQEHPDIGLAPGEPQYFANYPQHHPLAYLQSLAGRFPSGSSRPLMGDKSPASLAMDDSRIALCAAMFPDLKLICTVREPVSRAWSQIRHEAKARESTGVPGPAPPLSQVLTYGRYRSHLTRWARRFPADRFLLLDFEQMEQDPEAIWRETLGHLGAARRARPKIPFAMEGSAPPDDLRRRLEEEYEGEVSDVDALRGAVRNAWALAGRTDEAGLVAALRTALQAKPDDIPLRERLAQLLSDGGRAGEALPHLRVLTQAQPRRTSRWSALATALAEAGDTEAEISAWTRALELDRADQQDWRIHHRLAVLLVGAGRHAEASVHFRALAETDPSNPERWRRLARSFRDAGDVEGELDACVRLLKLKPSDHKMRGRALTLTISLGRRASPELRDYWSFLKKPLPPKP